MARSRSRVERRGQEVVNGDILFVSPDRICDGHALLIAVQQCPELLFSIAAVQNCFSAMSRIAFQQLTILNNNCFFSIGHKNDLRFAFCIIDHYALGT